MASLLVYLDPARAQRMLPKHPRGALWTLHADELADELAHLDDGSSLFVVTLASGAAVLVAYLEAARDGRVLGEATVCDHDITHLLPRLGCARAEDLPAWANLPRVLPPGDVDLLLTRPPPAEAVTLPPVPQLRVVATDPTAARLLAAIYDDLGSDAARLVYADYLQEQGDPRGELIALQLARHASGEPASERERDLVAMCGDACVGRVARYLRPNFVLRRGFLAACAVAQPNLPDDVLRDIAWSTVEELHTTNGSLLDSPALVSASRVGNDGAQLARAIACAHALPIEVLVGYRPELGPAIDQPGVGITDDVWDALDNVGALVRVRALGAWMGSMGPRRIGRLARTRLGEQLRHADVWLGSTEITDTDPWRRAFDRSPLHRLTLRFLLRQVGSWKASRVCIALERMAGPHRFVLQLVEPLAAEGVQPLMRIVGPLGRGLERIEVQDLGDPDRVAERQHRAIRALAPMFAWVMPSVGPLLAP